MSDQETRTFEAIKVSMRQDKDGHIILLRIHPDDIPEDLHKDWVGSRYMVAMALLDEEGKPVEKTHVTDEGIKLVQQAGMLCRDETFYEYLQSTHDRAGAFPDVREGNEKDRPVWCKALLLTLLGIESRADLKSNTQAQSIMETLIGEYRIYRDERHNPANR
jgi:hypothetical protein